MPRLISSHECQYHVEWATEYACPAVELVSHTCELRQPANNLAIDLRSLGTGDEKLLTRTGNVELFIIYT